MRQADKALDAISELQHLLHRADQLIRRVKGNVSGEPLSYADSISSNIQRLRRQSDTLHAFVARHSVEQAYAQRQ